MSEVHILELIDDYGIVGALPYAQEIRVAYERLPAEQQHVVEGEPTALMPHLLVEEELAAHLGWSVARVAQLDLVGQETRSLNARLHADDDGSELGDILPGQRFDPAATALDASLRHDVAATLARLLTERERRFLRAYFGFDTGAKVTLEEIGAAEGLTRERVRQVIAGALATLRDDPMLAAYREPISGA